MAPFLKYTVLRLALFLVALLTFGWLGAGPLLAAVLAALVSMGLSYVLLRGPREEMATAVADRISGRVDKAQAGPRTAAGKRLAEDTEIEDAAVDRIAEQGRSGGTSSADDQA